MVATAVGIAGWKRAESSPDLCLLETESGQVRRSGQALVVLQSPFNKSINGWPCGSSKSPMMGMNE